MKKRAINIISLFSPTSPSWAINPNLAGQFSKKSKRTSQLKSNNFIFLTKETIAMDKKFELIKKHFDKPLYEAISYTNMSRTEIKEILKENGINRWPYHGFRKMKPTKSEDAPFKCFKLDQPSLAPQTTPQSKIEKQLPSFKDLIESIEKTDKLLTQNQETKENK
jgi:hypothetical protein